jgi:anti-sigma factor RsiW
MDCADVRHLLGAHLDNELAPAQALAVTEHLSVCRACADEAARQATVAFALREHYPRLLPPPALAARVERLLRSRSPGRPARALVLVGALAATLALVVARLLSTATPAPPDLVRLAIERHLEAADAERALAVRSEVPAEVNAWFARSLAFRAELPQYGKGEVRLDGGAVTDLGGEPAALARYHLASHPISLFMLPERPLPRSAETVRFHDLEFHFFHARGLNVVAWNHRRLSYLLVSDVAGRGERACVVCHSEGGGDLLAGRL